MKWFWRSLDLILGAIFIYAGALKAMGPIRFANDIENYHLIPWTLGVGLAFYLPWLEIFCGLALITRRLYSGALGLLTILVFIFVGASLTAKWRGINIACGCFGAASKNLGFSWHLVLDLLILAGLIVLWRRRASNRLVTG